MLLFRRERLSLEPIDYWLQLGQRIAEHKKEDAWKLFQPVIQELLDGLEFPGQGSELSISYIDRLFKGDMLQACEKLPLWLRESDPMAEIAEIFLRSLPRREYNPSPYVTINNFLLLFHSNLIRHIRKQIKDQERRQTIRQTFKETDITVDVLPDYLLLDFLQQQEPWLRQYALQRYLGLTQEEIAELCHLTKRTLIKDEKRLCRLLKKRQFSK